ncbi:MAG TPA: hypothetical protein VMT61_19425 [Candidatus Binataceae bacterium]|nr:hypothetical protein [Candidatus Binataceae bacterium]
MKAPVMADALRAGRDRLVQELARFGIEAPVVDGLLSRHTLVRYPRDAMIFAQGAPADMLS